MNKKYCLNKYAIRFNPITAFWLILLILAGWLPGAWAQITVTTTNLPAYESFATTYTEGEYLGGTTTVLNWPYGNSSSSSGARVLQAAALNYPSLLTEDTNSSRGLKNGSGTGKNRGFNFSPAISNGTIYASFLFNVLTNTPAGPRLFACLSSSTAGTGPAVESGVYLDTANHLLVGKNASLTATTLPVSANTYSLVPSNTYLVVVSYTFNPSNNDDNVSLWLNPTSLGNNASVPPPSITSTNGTDMTGSMQSFCYIGNSSGLNTVVPFYMDELRIGTNWSDVTPTNSTAGNFYTLSGGGSGCQGAAFPVNLSGSASGTSYLLYTNGVYSGVSLNGTGSSLVFSSQSTTATYTVLATNNTTGGISWMPGSASITVLTAPVITVQPTSAVAATNSTIQFSVVSDGSGLGYSWYFNGQALSDGGNVAGSSTPTLTISPVLATNAGTATTGYYCVITNSCGYQAISTTNALTVQTANNLVWQGTPTNLWDVAITASWTNSAGTAVTFNQGDNVTLDDSFQNSGLLLNNPYLSPGNISYKSTQPMFIAGSGNIFGSASSLIATGSGTLTISNANSFAGGTVISNSIVSIQNYAALGVGTVTLSGTGSSVLDIGVKGSASSGLPGPLNVTADSTLKFDNSGTYACVLLGPLTGAAGKTLTITGTSGAATDNFRLFNTNFTCNCNINLNIAAARFAPYNGAGTQTYNGAISGTGTLYTRNGNATIILNGANTYNGGTLLSLGSVGVGIDSASDLSSGPFGPGAVLFDNAGDIDLFASGGAHTVGNPFAYTTNNPPGNAKLVFKGTDQLTLSGTFNLSADGATSGTNRTIQVDNTNAPGVLSGVISDQSQTCGIIKAGGGVLYLNGVNTYTGPTTISAGRLAGIGAIVSPVTVDTNGALGGGATAIGTLTVNNTVTLSGGAFIRVNKSLSPAQSNDVVSVSGSLVNSGTGTVTVTNLGTALQPGDKFKIFNKAVVGGNTLTITGAGVTWTNKLAVDGTIQVASTIVASTPPGFSSGGVAYLPNGTVALTATGALGSTYKLWGSTNIALTPVTNTWTLVSNGTVTVSPFTISDLTATNYSRRFYLFSAP